MVVGAEGCVSGRIQRLAEGGVPRQIVAQHQGIDEEADQRLKLGASAIGDGRSDHDAGLAAIPGQQHLESRQQCGEQRGPGVSAQAFKGRSEIGAKHRLTNGAAEALGGRARAVRRQLEELGNSGELPAPVRELAFEDLTP